MFQVLVTGNGRKFGFWSPGSQYTKQRTQKYNSIHENPCCHGIYALVKHWLPVHRLYNDRNS